MIGQEIDRIKDEYFAKQRFELCIETVKEEYAVVSNQKEPLNYVKKLFYPSGVNGIKIYEGIAITTSKKVEFVYNTRDDDFDSILREIREKWMNVGRVSPIRASYYEVYEKDNERCFVQDYIDETSGEHLILSRNGDYVIFSKESKYEFMILARFLREIAFRHLENEQYVSFHSSSVIVGQDGYLIIGDSGAGKSTMALTLCKYFGAHYVSNDRLLVCMKNNELHAVAYGMPVKVNYGTLKTLGVSEQYETWNNMIPMVSKDSFFDYKGEHKLNLLSGELEQYLQIKVASEMTIKGIILPSIRREGNTKEKRSVREVLEQNCYYDNDPVFNEDWLKLRVQPRVFTKKQIIDRLMELPIYREEIEIANFKSSADRLVQIINKRFTL